jgi:hypothetical protein
MVAMPRQPSYMDRTSARVDLQNTVRQTAEFHNDVVFNNVTPTCMHAPPCSSLIVPRQWCVVHQLDA